MDYERLLRAALNDAHYERNGYSADGCFDLTDAEQEELDRIEEEVHAAAVAQKNSELAALRAENPGKTDQEIRQKMLNDAMRMMLSSMENRLIPPSQP